MIPKNDGGVQAMSNSGNVGKSKPSNYLRDLNDNADSSQLEYLRKQIDEHQNIIDHLKMSIEVNIPLIEKLLEMKYKNSQEIENKLKKKVKELVDKLRSLGVNEQY